MKRIAFFTLFIAAVALQVNAQLPQVWDLGAQQLSDCQNMLSEAEINSWFDVEPGSTNINVSDINASDSCNFRFDGGGKTNHRLRTTNEALTCYDRKSLKDADGNVYSGYIYSNAGSNPNVFIEQNFEAGDKIEYYVGSNGGAETYVFQSPSGVQVEGNYTAAAKIEKLTFYVGETGKHRIFGKDEKLVVARIVRTPALKGGFEGKVVAPKSIPDTYQLVFTNTATGHADSVAPQLDDYKIEGLSVGYEYAISLANANGYIVTTENPVALNETSQKLDIEIKGVSLSTVSGKIDGLTENELSIVEFEFTRPADKIYQPEYYIDRQTGEYNMVLETNVEYAIDPLYVNDYEMTISTIKVEGDVADFALKFVEKPRYNITIKPTGLDLEFLSESEFVFTNLNEKGYVYKFTGPKDITLRDGVYNVVVNLINVPLPEVSQLLTSNLVVNGADVTKIIDFEVSDDPISYDYMPEIYVEPSSFGEGAVILPDLKLRFATINEALDAVRHMNRGNDQRVTIFIEPGNYEEMLKIDLNNITLRNASLTPSNALKNGGVDIDDNAVRITGYYGCGYSYASMGKDFFWDARTLQVNKENGYASTVNQGGTSSSYWNAVVLVSAKDFEAYDIIFENSFNQYISKKESEDVVYEIEGASKGTRPTEAGNTDVQKRSFRERACAIAFTKTADRAYLENCRVVGRQDAIYGDQGARVAIQGGALMGACDYIFGGMTLVCNETELEMLVTNDGNDVTYITAAKQDAGVRGYLFNKCHVTSAKPEIDMVETAYAKPGYWGRPWSPNAETVFFNTIVDSCLNTAYSGRSLINAEGWNNGLTSSGSPRSYEYGTQECVDNSDKRIAWGVVLTEPVLTDGTKISLFNFTKGKDDWNPFQEDISGIQTVSETELDITVVAADNILTIGRNMSDMETTQCTIYDISGRQIMSQTINAATSIYLSNGIYIVNLQRNSKSQTVKIRI